jgi:spore maturation protein SpmB
MGRRGKKLHDLLQTRYARQVSDNWRSRIREATATGLKEGLRTVLWLLSIMIPVSFAVFLLQWFGLLTLLGRALGPGFAQIGLPGSTAIVFLSGLVINLYSAIAAMAEIGLNLREVTTLALVGLCAHNFLVEIPVLASAGAPPARMVVLRLAGAIIAALSLGALLPSELASTSPTFGIGLVTGGGAATFPAALLNWAGGAGGLVLRVAIIVATLMVAEQWMHAFGVTRWLGRRLRPLMKVFGLPDQVAFLWVISNTLGLAYGAGVVRREVAAGELSRADGDLWCHHVALSHSLLEDTLLFVALGVPALWIIVPRVVLAVAAVWERRLERRIRRIG